MDQPTVTGGPFCQAISKCFNLVSLDLTGDVNIDDNSINSLTRGDMMIDEKMTVIGLKNLEEVKLNGLAKLFDVTLLKLC